MSNHRFGKGSTTLYLFIFIYFVNTHMCLHMYVRLCRDQKSKSDVLLSHSPCYCHVYCMCIQYMSDCGECAHVHMSTCVLYMCLCVYIPEEWKLKPITLHLIFWDRRSHWTWNSSTKGWRAGSVVKSTCSHLGKIQVWFLTPTWSLSTSSVTQHTNSVQTQIK